MSKESEVEQKDMVNSPSHYTQFSQEVIETIKEWTKAYRGDIAYLIGSSLKYLARAPFKHMSPLEDLKKARVYLDHAIKKLEEELGS